MSHPLQGVYAITDTHLFKNNPLQRVEAALIGGAKVLQYRDKSDHKSQRISEATALLQLCQQYKVPLIINDDVPLAVAVGADGVHLGRDDTAIQNARAQLGEEAIIGISCYNDLSAALAAESAGADYVAFGRFFSSSTKPDAAPANIEILRQASAQISLPLVAIGGITPENGGQLIEAGADMLAVVQGIFGQPDIRSATQQFQQLF